MAVLVHGRLRGRLVTRGGSQGVGECAAALQLPARLGHLPDARRASPASRGCRGSGDGRRRQRAVDSGRARSRGAGRTQGRARRARAARGRGGRQRPDRQRPVRADLGAVRRREPRTDARGGRDGAGSRRDDFAWRRLQTAHQPALVPGSGCRGAEVAGRGWPFGGSAGDHRGAAHRRHRRHQGARRHAADRRAQHAELRVAARGRSHADAGAAQARAVGDHQGVVVRGRLHPGRGQPPGGVVRARHPHVRDGDPQHAGRRRGRGAQGAFAVAGDRRSFARCGAPRVGRAVGPGGGGSGRRWPDRRGAPQPRRSVV